MAVTADVDIANLALAQLGQDAIASLDSSTRDASICTRVFDQNREYCLSLYDWVTVTERLHMVRAGKTTITSIAASNPVIVSCPGHDFVNGNYVWFEVSGMTQLNNTAHVVGLRSTTSILLYSVSLAPLDGSAYTAFTSGTVYHYHTTNWDYVYDLPSTCLRVINVLDYDWGESLEYTWKRIQGRLYCNLQDAAVEFVEKDVDVTRYDDQLVEMIAARLAWVISPKITSDETILKNTYQNWVSVSAIARNQNAKGRQHQLTVPNLWKNAGK
jgi:hypothetical protein